MWWWALGHPGWASLSPVVFIFGVVPALDHVIGTVDRNPDAVEATRWTRRRVWSALLYAYVLSHFLVLGRALMVADGQSWWIVVAIGAVTGLFTGALGITVAHEFSHKASRVFTATAGLLLMSVWYHHFLIEHVRGHHVRVATPDDPATAPLGETAYAFLRRSIVFSFVSALKLERRRTGATWTWRNHVTMGVLGQVAITVFLASLGPKILVCFVLQAAVAVTLLELINYIEHYGLNRRRLASGRFERVGPEHSWNSSHGLTNAIFFNLQRHSDHHASSAKPFTVLRHHADVPQLPYGYPTMVLIALCPPLWFRLMNPRVRAWREESRAS